MHMCYKVLSGFLILCCLANFSRAQKIYYSPGQEDCNKKQTAPADEAIYSVLLIGDITYPDEDSEVLKLLKTELTRGGTNSAVVFLGDLVYPLGLPDTADKLFDVSETYLRIILNTLEGYPGEVIFMPGNHDWAKGRVEGWESVQHEEAYIEDFLNSGNVYLPDGGCPGPVEVSLSDDVTLIVFDAEWWFRKNIKPGITSCDYEDIEDLFVGIEDALRRNRDKKVIFASHHPLYSVGYHGGYFPASYLLFPLLEFKNWLYLPLPGFIYTGYRKYLGHLQDLAHPEYKILKATLLNLFSAYPNVIYAAGHEHNLQYFEKDSLFHIISGGGGEGTYIARRKKKTDFAADQPGISRLDFYSDGDVWVEFLTPCSEGQETVLFRKKMFNKAVFDQQHYEDVMQHTDFSDSTVRVQLSEIYKKGEFSRFWLGDNYRDIWNVKVSLPVFDIGQEKGGLTILKRGGGQQTRSIRMEDSRGRQYVLRSINKFVGGSLDESLRGTFAEGLVQDFVSASNPFASLSVPIMADAAGVMHTNPSMVWVPDDPRLGIYREDLANNAFLFEERPSGNWSDTELFRGSEKIISTDKVINKTQQEHDQGVDQLSVVNARLFDFFIADWDRHDDQWRWASFKEDKQTIYQPIPRDRDQVFFINEGVIMGFVGLPFIMPKFQGFDHKIRTPRGLGFNARYFDRSFMTEPALSDWQKIAESVTESLTDSVIDRAVSALPPEVYEAHGKKIEDNLKARREQLPEYAEKYYRFLSKTVDVVGTEKREYFDVQRLSDGQTLVDVYALSKKKGKNKGLLYHRQFSRDETREIRLYGLDGKDKFEISGEVKKGTKIRVIGGPGKDTIVDRSRVSGPAKKTIIYDRKDKKNYIDKSQETRLKLSNDKSVNEYDRKQFNFNLVSPLLGAGYNGDDGIYLGGGVLIKRYNFRDSTFHRITGKFAFRTGAFIVAYRGLFSSISRYFDLTLNADMSMPRNVDYFYGLGNNTEKEYSDRKYYRVRYAYAWVNPKLKHTINENIDYSFGAFYQYFEVTDTTDRYIGELYPEALDSTAYLPHHYTGVNASVNIDTRNNKLYPARGVIWNTEAFAYYSILDEGKNFIKLRSDLGIYLSSKRDPRFVLALRVGGSVNIGEYEFFHANFLGNKTSLRGFRSNRFAGDASFYQNTELRFKLLNFKNYVFNGQTGFLLFNDIGRVWLEGEDSKRWHDGFGIGVWLIPFELTVFTITYEHSKEENLISFHFSFLF